MKIISKKIDMIVYFKKDGITIVFYMFLFLLLD